MKINRRQLLAAASALGLIGCGSDDNGLNPAQAQTAPLSARQSRLFVVTGQSGSQVGDRLVLNGVSPETVFFDDRPARVAGRQTTASFVADWGAYGFTADPPNAVLQVGLGTAASSHAFELLEPVYDGAGTLSFRVRQDQGDAGGPAPASFGPATLFIDDAGAAGPSLTFTVSLQEPNSNLSIQMESDGAAAAFVLAPFNFQFMQLGLTAFNENQLQLIGQGEAQLTVNLAGSPAVQSITLRALFVGATVSYVTRRGARGTLSNAPTVLPWASLF